MNDYKYTKESFLVAVRKKYPAYVDWDDDELYARFLKKYPVYKDQITPVEPTPLLPQEPLKEVGFGIARDALKGFVPDPTREQYPDPVTEIAKTYLREGDDAMKWLFSGMPEFQSVEEIGEFKRGDWYDALSKYNPAIKALAPNREDLREVDVMDITRIFLGDMLSLITSMGTKPSTWITWGVLQRAAPFLTNKLFKKLPPNIQSFLAKKRYFWGKDPVTKAYKFMGLKKGASDEEIKNAYRIKARKWHPDMVEASKKDWARTRWDKLQDAYDLLMTRNIGATPSTITSMRKLVGKVGKVKVKPTPEVKPIPTVKPAKRLVKAKTYNLYETGKAEPIMARYLGKDKIGRHRFKFLEKKVVIKPIRPEDYTKIEELKQDKTGAWIPVREVPLPKAIKPEIKPTPTIPKVPTKYTPVQLSRLAKVLKTGKKSTLIPMPEVFGGDKEAWTEFLMKLPEELKPLTPKYVKKYGDLYVKAKPKEVKPTVEKPPTVKKVLPEALKKAVLGEIGATWIDPDTKGLAGKFKVEAMEVVKILRQAFEDKILETQIRGRNIKYRLKLKKVPVKEEAFAPKEAPERPPLSEPIKLKAVSPTQIAKELGERLDIPIKRGKFRRRSLGIYKVSPQIIRFKRGGIATISHEVGHHLQHNLPELDFTKLPIKKFVLEMKRLDYDFPKKKRPSEGFSEFIRFYVTNPNKAQTKAPKFFKYFEGMMTEKYPDIQNTLLAARNEYWNWLALPPEERVRLQVSFDNPEIATERKIDKLYRMFIDELNPITLYVKKAAQLGVQVKPHENPDILAHLFSGWVAKADQMLRYNTFNPRTLETTGKSLSEVMKPIKGTDMRVWFSVYLVSKHVPDWAKAGLSTSVDLKDALRTIRVLEKRYPSFRKTAIEFTKYRKRLLEYAQASDILSPTLVKEFVKLYRHYVPFYRVLEKLRVHYGGTAFANPPKVVWRAKGEEFLQIVDPIESTVKDTYAFVNSSDRNVVNLSMKMLSKRNKYLGRAFEHVPVKMVRVAKIDIEKELGIKVSDKLAEKIVNIFRPSVFTPKDNTIPIFEKGKVQWYEVEPTIYRAMTGMDKEQMGFLIRLLSRPAKWLRAGAILTPEFSLARNPNRDQLTAFLFSRYGYRPYYDMLRGLSSIVKKDKYFIMWNRTGGPHAALISMDRNYIKQTTEELLGRAKWKYFAENPLEALRVIGELTEEATRIGETRLGLEQKADPFEAAYASKEVSIDFSRKGTVGRTLNQIIAFWNPAVQGPNKVWRMFKEHPRRTFWRAILGLTLPSIALWFYNKKYNPRWDDIPQWQKDLFWIFPVRVPTKMAQSGIILVRMPKPFLMGMVFASLPERMLDYMADKDPNALKELGKTALEGALPGFIPTALSPVLENLTNYNFFRKMPIVPTHKLRLEPELQYTIYTSEVAKKIGALLNYSPMKVDNMLYGYFAGLGKMAIEGIDATLQLLGMTEIKVDPMVFWFEKPIIRAFIVREPIGSASESVNKLYDYYKRADMEEQTWKQLDKKDPKKAEEYLSKHPRALLASHYRSIIAIMGGLRQKRDEVYQNNELTAKKKRLAIIDVETFMTKLANRTIEPEKYLKY